MADHAPECGCKVCKARQAAQAQRRAAAELEQTRRDVAWFEVMGQGGPDAVLALARQHGDTGRARRLLAAAGLDADAIMSRYWDEAPVQRQASAQFNAGYAGDPDHDERVTRGLLHGVPDAELNRIRAEVHAEYAGRALERQARQQSGVLWRTRDGGVVVDGQAPVLGASYGASGAPQQRSAVHADVPELGEG